MKVAKSLFPIVSLLIGAFYGYQKYSQLPEPATIGITYLMVMLAIIVVGLSIRFSRSSMFFYVLLIIVTYVVLSLGWVATDLGYGLFSAFIPLLLLILTVLPDRGIFSVKAIPAYGILLGTAIFTMLVVNTSPDWALTLVLSDWLPPQYFDWTGQSQTVLLISFAALYVMFTLCILNPSLHVAAGFGVLCMLISELHFGVDRRSLDVYGSAALLVCLYAIMQETWRMAYLDELTGLAGRRALSDKFRSMSGLYTVAMLDVDHFKKFNDSYGHDAGDAVLRMIAGKLGKIAGGGLPYRYGGEEFAIIFTGKDSREAVRYLEALREAICSKPFVIRRASRRDHEKSARPVANNSVTVTASIGFAESRGGKSSPWDVLKQADQALYRAKGKGRNCVSE